MMDDVEIVLRRPNGSNIILRVVDDELGAGEQVELSTFSDAVKFPRRWGPVLARALWELCGDGSCGCADR